MAGASPETLVKLEDGVLHTFPLAGTRKIAEERSRKIWLLRKNSWTMKKNGPSITCW